MYEHRVNIEGKWSKTSDLYSTLKNHIQTKNTILYAAIGAINSMINWENQMPIHSATHIHHHTILFADETLKIDYLLVYYSLFGSEIPHTITQSYLMITKWNYFDTHKIYYYQQQTRGIFPHISTISNRSR